MLENQKQAKYIESIDCACVFVPFNSKPNRSNHSIFDFNSTTNLFISFGGVLCILYFSRFGSFSCSSSDKFLTIFFRHHHHHRHCCCCCWCVRWPLIRIEKCKKERTTNDLRASVKSDSKKHTCTQPKCVCVCVYVRASARRAKKEHNLWSMVLLFSPSEIYIN